MEIEGALIDVHASSGAATGVAGRTLTTGIRTMGVRANDEWIALGGLGGAFVDIEASGAIAMESGFAFADMRALAVGTSSVNTASTRAIGAFVDFVAGDAVACVAGLAGAGA